MAAYNYQNSYFPQATGGGAQFSPYVMQPAIQQLQQQPQQTGSILMIQIQSDEEVNTYPVAAGTTVMLINFSTEKFWLKSTSTSGVPEPIRKFSFKEEVTHSPQTNAVTREEFNSLSEKIDKLLKDLGGDK